LLSSTGSGKLVNFDRLWRLIQSIDLNAMGYLGQTYFAFRKLAELSFEKRKSYNASLIVRLRALLLTLEYEEESAKDITE